MDDPSRAKLTVDQAREALTRLGPADPRADGTAHCPVCGPVSGGHKRLWTLAVSQNGTGAHLKCANGCSAAAIVAVLKAALGTLGPASAPDSVEVLNKKLGLHIAKVVKRGAGDSYELQLDDGKIVELGNTRALLDRNRFREALLGQADHLVPRLKPAEHDELVALIDRIAERHEVLSASEETAAWISEFARAASGRRYDLENSDDVWEIVSAATPVFRTIDNRIGLRLDALATWINRQGAGRVTQRELSPRLGRLDFTKPDHGGKLSARRDKDTQSRRYWLSPLGFGDRG